MYGPRALLMGALHRTTTSQDTRPVGSRSQRGSPSGGATTKRRCGLGGAGPTPIAERRLEPRPRTATKPVASGGRRESDAQATAASDDHPGPDTRIRRTRRTTQGPSVHSAARDHYATARMWRGPTTESLARKLRSPRPTSEVRGEPGKTAALARQKGVARTVKARATPVACADRGQPPNDWVMPCSPCA